MGYIFQKNRRLLLTATVAALGIVGFPRMASCEGQSIRPPDARQRQQVLLKNVSAASSSFNYTFVKVRENGPWKNRVNMVYATDGYTQSELPKGAAYVDSQIKWRTTQYLYARPFPRYAKFFNFYRIDAVSQQSGMSSGGTTVNNALGAAFDGDRVAYINDGKGNSLVSQVQKEAGIAFNWKTAIVNANKYANSGEWMDDGKGRGTGWTVFCYPQYGDICLHEGGHTFSHLADEYSGGGADNTEYGEINSTHSRDGSKWGHWIGYKDKDPKLWSGAGVSDTVGYYQGSRYASAGQYRPTFDSRMNETAGRNSAPFSFNVVCREKIVHDIYNIVHPIDTVMDTIKQAANPDSVWVKVIDPDVIHVDWYVDNALKKANGGTSLKISDIASAIGAYTVKAHAYDECIRHMNSDNKNPDTLDIVRKDTTKLVQDVRWTVQVTSVKTAFSRRETRPFYAKMVNAVPMYDLPRAEVVSVKVFNSGGAVIAAMWVNGHPGGNRLRLPCIGGARGRAPGIYFVIITAADLSQVVPLTISR